MQFEEYVPLAVRTENHIGRTEQIQHGVVLGLLLLLRRVCELLDMQKKLIFYGRAIEPDDEDNAISDCVAIADRLRKALRYPRRVMAPLAIDPRVFHGVLGKLTEGGELAAAIYDAMDPDDPGELDTVNLLEELGDDQWYNAILLDALKADMGDVLARNIAKLKHRYPKRFTAEKANDRDLAGERTILEQPGKPGFDVWGEDKDYPRRDWHDAVSNGDTNLGYWDWVGHQKEIEK